MVKMNINLGSGGYPIYISRDFSGLGKACANAGMNGKTVVITDTNVESHYCADCVRELESGGAEVYVHVIQAGEKSKTLETVSDIYRKLTALRVDRSSALAALGGGVTGDITGFAAATYMRGIRFIQIPTSLIAQADSSIGGKTGVDFEGSKNMIGAFYQPKLVYINVNTLRSLPVRELKSGLAEVIKHGLIRDAEFFEYIDYNIEKIHNFDETVLAYMAKMNCTIKGNIVEQDEREGGLREILNFGHTIGHAVECESDFTSLHGECVAIGMAAAFRLALRLGIVDARTVGRVENTLNKVGLPVKIHAIDTQKIFDRMFFDKKVKDGKLNFVIPKAVGEVIRMPIEDMKLIKEVLKESAE